MVSGFFGKGFAEAAQARRTGDIQEAQVALGSDRLQLLRDQLQEKSELARTERLTAMVKTARDQLNTIATLAASDNPRSQQIGQTLQRNLGPQLTRVIQQGMASIRGVSPESIPVEGIPDPSVVSRTTRPTTFEQKLDVFKEQIQRREGREASPDEILGFLQQQTPAGTIIRQNPDGTFSVQVGGSAAPSGTTGAPEGTTPLPATAVQKTSEGIEAAKAGVATVNEMLELPRGSLGAQAKLRRMTREAGRVVGDVTALGLPEALEGGLSKIGQFADDLISISVEQGTLDAEQAKEFQIDPLTSARGLQQRLTFLYARALQPSGERLLKDTIKEAQEATDFDSFFISEQTVRERLAFLARSFQELENRITRTVPRVGGAPPETRPEQPPQQPELETQRGAAEAEEGDIIVNPQTGERRQLRDGQWVPIQ